MFLSEKLKILQLRLRRTGNVEWAKPKPIFTNRKREQIGL